ncbi:MULTISPECIES: RNA-guided endonuclease InsQ/TnpB family protein [Glycomyces]|uniref:RNA-guided endonuclease TnpB family protein n=2 Tax=Glycomyces TaxID=58113 RepID=A0A9X3PP69_9ACTN|nr:RNA-guided endonuclease TnpB family protein [Glycomyces lechevalierae]MDA1387506.1 RNA-guided endonuclease TnpB family protein [Glycomyces lechevalierae]MDR7338682.1 putative transposase [Glycomyces lechevalierae]
MRKGFRVRLYPDPDQAAFLLRTMGCARLVWNRVLAWRRERWAAEGKSTSFREASAYLTMLKRDPDLAFLNEVSAVPLQQSLRRQQRAFTNFFAGRAAYPRFKVRGHKASMTLTRSAFRVRDGELHLAKMERPVRWVWTFDLAPGDLDISSLAVTCEPDGSWWAALNAELSEDQQPERPEPSGRSVGVDLGIREFGVPSDGAAVLAAPDLKRKETNRRRYQRRMARKESGSKNLEKARRKAARAYRKERQAREDMLQQATTRLVREYDLICIEDLRVSAMVKNRCLARAIARMGWRRFRVLLEAKCAQAGKRLVVIDRWEATSKRCSSPGCGFKNETLSLAVREWACPRCGARHDRDVNAAKNILAAGLAVLAESEVRAAPAARPEPSVDKACGARVRPRRHPPPGLRASKQETTLSDEVKPSPCGEGKVN